MSDQDEPDVVEQAPRPVSFLRLPGFPAGRRPRTIAAAALACVLLAVGGTLAAVRLTSSGPADPALAALITEATTVPVSTTAPDGGRTPENSGPPITQPSLGTSSALYLTLLDAPVAVSGRPLGQGGKPEVLYVSAGYCPYCAAENWALVVALSRFGQFGGLATSRSAQFEDVPPVDTWTFSASSFTSRYLAFVPVETRSSVLVNPAADKAKKSSYRVLQQLTPAEQAVFRQYDTAGSIPFIDFANHAVQVGSGLLPTLLAGQTWKQIAAALRQPQTPLGGALLDEADSLTTELCRLTGNRPASACPRS